MGEEQIQKRVSFAGDPKRVREVVRQIQHLMMVYEFGMDEVMTKINILRREFRREHDYNPIEHVSSRLKSAKSLVRKMNKLDLALDAQAVRDNIFDIAGIRLTCSFVSDIYHLRDLLLRQNDITLLQEKDYIKSPKPNGYQSLHLVVEVPVFLANSVEHVPVELQLRTVAMDFWASLEHKIYYKYDMTVPDHLTHALKLAADVAATLDTSMERIHDEVLALDAKRKADIGDLDEGEEANLTDVLLRSFPEALFGGAAADFGEPLG